ncbi:Rossmann-like alpha/beta/alpha sandwich fold [Vigna unguiculata]|uniref:Rossmann-like alpha/beta/alpha sandwich fold n=1 Tax=Vigna unguiculata TaxID=3917 RepID=A0A4D6KZX2_VIGUN|nr:Rossmann-like alpha/beta/alpha sandwich fold [Vigna unguiculata]
MDVRNIAVVVEDVDAARTALQWALHNIIRYGDIITLLHVYPLTRSKSKNKARLLRLKGFQLALSFQDICNNFSNTKVEIVVTEENREGMKIVATVRELGASMLVVGLHDHSFLYSLSMVHNNVANYFNCRVLAINQPLASPVSPKMGVQGSSTNMDFSQIDLSGLQMPETPQPKTKLEEKSVQMVLETGNN